jgi:G3E family GTPase
MTDNENQESNPRLPVYILTGFLGSGKTTLLQNLLNYCQGRGLKVGLLVNDFGTVNVDALLLSAAQEKRERVELRQLSGGCACCTVSRELVIDLLEMTLTYELDLIIIEASGIADPLDLLDQITTPALLRRMFPAGVISVVDAARFVDLSRTMPLVQRQTQFADVLILNKRDLLDEAGYTQALSHLQSLNPGVAIYPTTYAEVDPALLLSPLETRLLNSPHGEHEHPTFHAFEYSLTSPMNRERFEAWVAGLSPEVLRAKGFVKFTGDPYLYLLQYLPGQSAITPLEPDPTTNTQLIFIGLSLNPSELQIALDNCAD